MSQFFVNYPGGGSGGGGGGSGVDVEQNGVPVVTGATTLNFIGATVTDAGGGVADITITSGSGNPDQGIPAGAINGSNVTFTITTAPSDNNAFSLYLDGLIQYQGSEYTISGTTITMATAPATGQTLYFLDTVSTGGGGGGFITAVANSANITNTVSLGTLISDLIYIKNGLRTSPQNITAGGGISFSGSQYFTKSYIQGSGGAVVVTANPQIAAGNADGQQLMLQSRSATNTVELQDGNGLAMNGAWIGGLNSVISFTWDGALWVEISRQ